MTPFEHFLIDIIQIFFRDWIENTIAADIGRCEAATDIFQPTLHNFLNKSWPIIFFYSRWYFLVRCGRKNLQCRSARLSRSSSTVVVVWPTPACFHLLGKESINPPRKKLDTLILIEKNASRHRPEKFTDRDLKKDHRVTPIEHFLIDINQILLRDCIENIIADIVRCEAATNIVQPTLRILFYKYWPIIFIYGKGSFVLGVAYNIFNESRLGFFVLAQPKSCFGRHRHVFIFLARKTLANLGRKTWFIDTHRKTC